MTVRTCIDGSLNMLRLARQSGASIFLASTSEVYGEPEMHPQKEGYRGSLSSIGPRACYDEGKRCAEATFFYYRRARQAMVAEPNKPTVEVASGFA